jgi:hypothetical protein
VFQSPAGCCRFPHTLCANHVFLRWFLLPIAPQMIAAGIGGAATARVAVGVAGSAQARFNQDSCQVRPTFRGAGLLLVTSLWDAAPTEVRHPTKSYAGSSTGCKTLDGASLTVGRRGEACGLVTKGSTAACTGGTRRFRIRSRNGSAYF